MAEPLSRSDSRRGSIAQFLAHSPNLIFVRDLAGRYLQVSRSYCETFGKSAAEFLGRTPAQALGERVGEQLLGSDRLVLESNTATEFDIELHTVNGPRAYRTLKFPMYDEHGKAYALCGIATDVTERKRHELALHGAAMAVSSAQGEALYRELVRYLTHALDVDGAFLAFCDVGQARTAALLMDDQFLENVQYSLPGTLCGTVVGKSFRYVPAQVRQLYPGDALFERFQIEAYAGYPLTDSTGRSIGLIAAVARRPLLEQNLAHSLLKLMATRAEAEFERMRAEADLRASESNYRAIFEASEEAIFVHDWDSGTIVDVNPKACQTFGYSYEEMKRLRVRDISSGVEPYTEQEARRRLEQAKAGVTQRFEWHRKNKDGSLHWDEVDLRSAVIAGERRILAFSREVTARKAAEEALREAAISVSTAQGNDIFRELVRSLAKILGTDYAFVATVKEDEPLTLLMLAFYSDGQIGERFDYPIKHTPCETVIGQSYRAYLSDLPKRFPHDGELSGLGVQSYAGFPINDADGTARGIVSVACRRPMIHPEMVESVLKIFASRAAAEIARMRAEEELRASEAQLRQAQKMETIGQLTGGIAHDFNNILTSILGYLMLASEYLEDHNPDERLTRYIEEANASAVRARDLIKQMLTFSRGQRGTPRPIDLAQVVGEGINMLRPSLPATIELNTRLERHIGMVMLDPVHLGQILLNLCINARDAMQQTGRLSVRVTASAAPADAVCASCRRPVRGHFATLLVRDTGKGISQEVQERMFEPFFTTKEIGKGTGMGLATVHGIVHENGGHVLVDSAPGRGTRFRVLFPLLPADEIDWVGESSMPRTGKSRTPLRGRVLVVDDERAVSAFMRDLLLSWGLEVNVENNPQRAEELVRAEPRGYDLVITDQTMPKLTGVALAERLHRLLPELPILLYTGYAEPIPEQTLRAAGIRAMLRKPVDVARLYDLMREYLPRREPQASVGTNI